ncbi:MAG: EamA family transporter [Steroidobacteraceae bacterium]
MPPTHWLLALVAVLIWGTNFVVIAWGLAELPPFLFCALRFFFTAFPLIFLIRRPNVRWPVLAAFGLLIGVGQFGLLFFALHAYITPGLASLLIQTQVIFTILLGLKNPGHRLAPLQVMAIAMAVAGIGAVAWRSVSAGGTAVTPLGVGLILAAGLFWALGNRLVQAAGRVDVIAFLVWSSVSAVPPLLLLSGLFDGAANAVHALTHMSARAAAALAWQVCGNTLFGFGVWNWLLARHPAPIVTPVALLVPVFGMTASAWLLKESLPAWKIAAAVLVLAGLALNAFASAKSRVLTSATTRPV